MSEQEKSLVRYGAIATISEDEAEKILTERFNGAPLNKLKEAALMCRQYGLNPLMNHIFIVDYKRYKDGKQVGTDWIVQLSIKAKRMIVSNNLRLQRLPTYGYVDDTPRLMTEAEEVRIYRKVNPDRIRAITILRWQGQDYRGYGEWDVNEPVKIGKDKGNTPENMAMIRSESHALEKLDPGALPADLPVFDERYVESTARELPHELPAGPARDAVREASPRDPSSLRSFGDLWKAVNEDFGLDRSGALQKLGVRSQDDVSGPISDLYLQIAAMV